jgi:sigma-E factor negative regulatory protein RseB
MVISSTASKRRWALDNPIAGINTLNLSSLMQRCGTVLWVCACGILAAFSLFGGEAMAVDSGNDTRMWLKKIASSEQTVSYEGVFIYRRDDQLITMHLIHVASEEGARDRLTSLSGGRWGMIRGKEGVVSLTPVNKPVNLDNGGLGSLGRNFPGQLSVSMQDLEKNYKLTMGDNDRIAGRNARMIIVKPNDAYRYGYRMWVDEKTGLLLQSDLVDEHGDAIEQVMFATINIVDKATPEMIQAVTMNDEMRRVLKSKMPETASAADMQWQVMRLPRGFSLVKRFQHSHGKWGPVEQLVLSDGIATVSVFAEQLGENVHPFNGVTHMGAVNAYGAVVDKQQLTVVGEVPLATVRLIGGSLRLSVAGQ